MPKEIIQVLTQNHGYEKLCEVNQENTWIQGNGNTHKCNDILKALEAKYPNDTFRVLKGNPICEYCGKPFVDTGEEPPYNRAPDCEC